MPARRLSWILAGALIGTACSGTTAGTGRTASVDPPVTTTTVAIREVTPDDPLRVVMMGDSVAGEVKLPIENALVEGGSTQFRFELVPSLPRTPRARQAWDDVLRDEDPDLVIVLVGYWEVAVLRRGNGGVLPPSPSYRQRQLRPFVDRATASGAEILWIGMPMPREPAEADDFAELDRRYATFAAEDGRVRYIPAEQILAGPGGGFTEILPGPSGPERVRWADGLHLCPDGSVRIARPALSWISDRWSVAVSADWPNAEWRAAPYAGTGPDCPPP